MLLSCYVHLSHQYSMNEDSDFRHGSIRLTNRKTRVVISHPGATNCDYSLLKTLSSLGCLSLPLLSQGCFWLFKTFRYFLNVFIYFILETMWLFHCSGLYSCCQQGQLSDRRVQPSHCSGFLFFWHMGSRAQALIVVAPKAISPKWLGCLPGQNQTTVCPALAGVFLPLSHQKAVIFWFFTLRFIASALHTHHMFLAHL